MPASAPIIAGLLFAICASTVPAAQPPKVATVDVHDRMIIAFVPSDFQGADDDGSIEGAAHLRFAVEDTYKCLQPARVSVAFLYADRVSLRNGANSEMLEVTNMGQAVGAILVEPGRMAQVVFSVDGPSTLQYLLPQAASRYWDVEGCKQ